MSEELKCCPFCGGSAHIGTVRYSRPLGDVRWSNDDAPVTEAFYGHCSRCCAGHKNSIPGGYRTQTEAITAWNTRATDQALREAREALTPSGDTKAAYMGEFAFKQTHLDEFGDEHTVKTYVPWTTVKEIMAAIRERAGLTLLGDGK